MHGILALGLAILFGPGDLVPDFDLALADADLVVVGRVERAADGARRVRVLEAIRGTSPGPSVPLTDTSRLGLHFGPPAGDAPHLLFLHAVHDGYIVTQYPGVVREWTPETAARLRPLLASLRDLARERPIAIAALPAHVAHARNLQEEAPDLAAAALRALARRPDLAPALPEATRRELGALLVDTRLDARVRDHAARCLAAAGDPTLPGTLVALLTSGSARGLGPVFGRLIAARAGARALPALQGAMLRAGPGAHSEVLHAAWATAQPEVRLWIRALAADPRLGPAVQATLGPVLGG